MLKSLKCLLKGHAYIDSRSHPGTQVCVRCRHRKPFEGLMPPPNGSVTADKSKDD